MIKPSSNPGGAGGTNLKIIPCRIGLKTRNAPRIIVRVCKIILTWPIRVEALGITGTDHDCIGAIVDQLCLDEKRP